MPSQGRPPIPERGYIHPGSPRHKRHSSSEDGQPSVPEIPAQYLAENAAVQKRQEELTRKELAYRAGVQRARDKQDKAGLGPDQDRRGPGGESPVDETSFSDEEMDNQGASIPDFPLPPSTGGTPAGTPIVRNEAFPPRCIPRRHSLNKDELRDGSADKVHNRFLPRVNSGNLSLFPPAMPTRKIVKGSEEPKSIQEQAHEEQAEEGRGKKRAPLRDAFRVISRKQKPEGGDR